MTARVPTQPRLESTGRARRSSTAACTCVVVAAIAAYVVSYSSLSIYRHHGLNSSGFDLAIQDQVVWNTSRGRLFRSSIETENFLGDHVSAVALLLAPLAWLPAWGVEWLLIAQSAALGLAAWPMYRLARVEARSAAVAAALALSYVLSPLPGFINRFDFHFIAFSAPCLMTMLFYLRIRHGGRAAVWAALAASCREEIGFAVAAVAVYAMFQPGMRRWGRNTAVASVLWSVLACFVIIPYFRGGPSDSISRYAWLGADGIEMLRTMVTRPLYVLSTLVTDPLRLHTLSVMFLPLALLPVLSPGRVLCMCVPLAIPMLQNHPSANSIYFHYHAPVVPLLWWSACGGASKVVRWARDAAHPRGPALAGYCLLAVGAALALARDNPFTKTTRAPLWEVAVGPPRTNVAQFREAAGLLRPDESVVASMALAPHLARREKIGVIGYVRTFQDPDCYLLDVTDFRWIPHPRAYGSYLEQILRRPHYGLVYAGNGVVLLRRGEKDQHVRAEVLKLIRDAVRRHGAAPG